MEKSVNLILILILVTSLYNGSFSLDRVNNCKFSAYESPQVVKEAVAKIAPLIGNTFSSQATVGDTVYKYTVGICTSTEKADPKLKDSAVTQKREDNGIINPKSRNIGSLTNVHIMSGTDWVYLEYKSGENYTSHCKNEAKRSIVVLTCDPDVDNDHARMVFIQEETHKSQECFYLFEMKHQAVCPTGVSSGGLSVGSVLLIIFFTVVGVYLLVGFLYSRFVLGNKGMEQIPNYEFWQDFGNLTADGCNLVCRSGSGRVRSGGLGGIGDDQLDSEEVLRDDNLLPM